MEQAFFISVVTIATIAAVIRFALLEWEGIVHAWMRVKELRKRTRITRDQSH